MVSGTTRKTLVVLMLAGTVLAELVGASQAADTPGQVPAARPTAATRRSEAARPTAIIKIDRAILEESDARFPGLVIETYRDETAQAKLAPAPRKKSTGPLPP